jgi:hypothetical protein
MVVRKSKLKISIKELSFEFEGSREEAQAVQHGLQQTLGSLMNTQARVLTHRFDAPQVIDAVPVDTMATGDERSAAVNGNDEKPKVPRQRRGKGPSMASLLTGLKQEGVFSQPRTGAEIVAHLKDNKGHNARQSTVLTELQRMTQRGDLFRTSNGDTYIYKDSPFNESHGSPNPPEQPAE